jgi:hypothetical protein
MNVDQRDILERLPRAYQWLVYYETTLAREMKHGPPRRGFVERARYWANRVETLRAELAATIAAEPLVWALEP